MRKHAPILMGLMLVGLASYFFLPYSIFKSSADGLLVLFGLLVAALVQVIPITATFSYPNDISVEETQRLVNSLEEQQKYWLGLLVVTALTCISIVIGKVIAESNLVFSLTIKSYILTFKVNSLLSAFTSTLVALVLLRALGLLTGVLSLQRLRGRLAVAASKRRHSKQEEELKKEIELQHTAITIAPKNYGGLIEPQKH